MTVHTTEITVTLRQESSLSSFERPQPAGTYRLVVVDEEIQGMSFIAHRRSSTILHLPAISTAPGLSQGFLIKCDELESVLKADDLQQHGGI